MPGVMMLSREAKRVPLDFDWPLDEAWKGYLSPDWRACPSDDCDNGSTIAAAWLEKIAHLILMLADAPDRGELHPWLAELPLQPDRPPHQNVKELTGGLAGRPPRPPLGHDAIDRMMATKAIVKAAGLANDWGTCPVCRGHAIHPDDLQMSEEWTPTEPPTGDGWQMWESVSEGSPISPVFETPELLAEWMAANDTSITSAMTREDWLAAIYGRVVGTEIGSGRPVGKGLA